MTEFFPLNKELISKLEEVQKLELRELAIDINRCITRIVCSDMAEKDWDFEVTSPRTLNMLNNLCVFASELQRYLSTNDVFSNLETSVAIVTPTGRYSGDVEFDKFHDIYAEKYAGSSPMPYVGDIILDVQVTKKKS